MAIEDTASTFERYIVARMALWAGDFEYFQALTRELAPRREFGKMPDSASGPEEIMQYSAALRSRQLSQKRGEFSQLAEALASDRMHVVPEPEVLKTAHLRGTVWRRGPRRFVMRAYLDDLGWEDDLLASAARLQHGYRGIEFAPTEVKTKLPSRSWLIPGLFMVEVVMGELGLIEADGFWGEIEREFTFRDVLDAFQRVLSELDPTDRPDERDRAAGRRR